MNVEESDFKRWYAELSDEGLLSISRDDLVDAARLCFDQELERRELQYDGALVEGVPSALSVLSRSLKTPAARRFWHWVRIPGSFFVNLLAATIGTAIVEAEFENVYHPATFAGLYAREMLLSVLLASLLGWVVAYKWKSEQAKWIWTLGACYLAWRLAVRLAPANIPDWDPVFNEGVRMIDMAVAIRTIVYSLGAWLCDKFVGKKGATAPAQEIESLPESTGRVGL